MKIKATGKLIDYDLENMSKTMRMALDRQLRNAVRAYIKAAILQIPIDTGEAKGSFLHLGRLLHVAVPNEPRRFRTYRRKGKTVKRLRDLNTKNKHTGARKTYINGKRSDQMTLKDLIKYNKYSFSFTMSTNIIQIDIHEDKWNAFASGRAAFTLYIVNELPAKMPKLRDHLKFTTIQS